MYVVLIRRPRGGAPASGPPNDEPIFELPAGSGASFTRELLGLPAFFAPRYVSISLARARERAFTEKLIEVEQEGLAGMRQFSQEKNPL